MFNRTPTAIRSIAAALIWLLAPCVHAAEPIVLKLTPVAGETQKLKATVEQKVTQTINGNPQSLTQSIGLGYTFATQAVAEDGVATVKVTYDTVSFKQVSPLGNVEYDSTNPPAQINPLAKGFAALAGQTFTMKVTSLGKITEIQGLDAMIDGIMKKLDIPEGPSKATIEKSIRVQFGEDALRDNMESLLRIYPDKPVSVGDTWATKISLSKGFPMVLDNTFMLKDAAADVATVGLTSKLATNPDTAPIDMGNRKLTYNLTGEQSGTIKVDRKSGWVKSAEMTQKVAGDMTADAGAGRINKTPMSIETKVTLEAK
jgi:hypothetical protein